MDLIEDSFIQVSRALSEERKDYIASLLKNSLTDTDLNYIEYKRLLSILGELNDLEILILKSMNLRPHGTVVHEFWVTHGEALTPPRLTIGTAVQRDFDKSAIFKTHNLHLLSLGLIKPVFSRIRDGELPKFDDETGMLHARRHQITDLGKLLLKCIDQN